jgi:hypothetical protein
MEHDTQHSYRGGWAGPGAALVLIAIGLIVLAWLEAGLMNTLMHG